MAFKKLVVPIATSLLLSFAYVCLLLYFTKGALLYGGDFQGFYSLSTFLQGLNLTSLGFYLGLALALGNIYAGFYISLFIGAFCCTLAISFLSNEMFKGLTNSKSLMIMAFIAPTLYLFNPTILAVSAQAFISNVYLINAMTAVFLAELVRLWRTRTNGNNFRVRDALILGVSLGLSLGGFPNSFRMLLVGILLIGYFLLISIRLPFLRLKKTFHTQLKNLTISALGVLAGGAFSFIPLLTNFQTTLSTAKQAAVNQGSLSFIQGSFNSLPQVFRLLGNWTFPINYAPYHNLYYQYLPIVLASFAWPILALGLPLILAKKNQKKLIIPIIILCVIMLFWEKAGNPPFGQLYLEITSIVPFGTELIPTYFLTTTILSKLYVVLASFSIISFVELCRMERNIENEIVAFNPDSFSKC